MAVKEASLIFMIVLGMCLMIRFSDAKCICCEKINDYCCEAPNKKDACCRTDGNIEDTNLADWTGKQCDGGAGGGNQTIAPIKECLRQRNCRQKYYRNKSDCDTKVTLHFIPRTVIKKVTCPTKTECTYNGDCPPARHCFDGECIEGTKNEGEDCGKWCGKDYGWCTKYLYCRIPDLTCDPGKCEPIGMPDTDGTIVEVAQATKDLSTLVAAVSAAGLVDTLNGDGPFTVFAPNNAAFEKIKDTVDELLKPENKDKLQKVLLRHVVPKKIFANEIPVGSTQIETAGKDTITVTLNNAEMPMVTITSSEGSATVIKTDVVASNGVVHIVDTVF